MKRIELLDFSIKVTELKDFHIKQTKLPSISQTNHLPSKIKQNKQFGTLLEGRWLVWYIE